MPCLKTILNCFALEHSAFKNKTFENVLRHGIRLNFSSDNPAFSLIVYELASTYKLHGEARKIMISNLAMS